MDLYIQTFVIFKNTSKVHLFFSSETNVTIYYNFEVHFLY